MLLLLQAQSCLLGLTTIVESGRYHVPSGRGTQPDDVLPFVLHWSYIEHFKRAPVLSTFFLLSLCCSPFSFSPVLLTSYLSVRIAKPNLPVQNVK
jgi:hypothetical protein